MADTELPSSPDLSIPKLNPELEEREENKFQRGDTPLKYISLSQVYSATSPCVTSGGSRKIKAIPRELPHMNSHDQIGQPHPISVKPTLNHVYFRRRRRKDREPFFFKGFTEKLEELEVEGIEPLERKIKRMKKGSEREGKNDGPQSVLENSVGAGARKWVWLSFKGIDPEKFIGLQCNVYWPLDASWYSGHIASYNHKTGRHHVKYQDEEEENLILSNERIKFHISFEETQRLKLKVRDNNLESDGIDVNEMIALAASLDDGQEIETGDVIWAKLTGHSIWPAIVLDESHVGQVKGLKKLSGEKSFAVQFFGTHDFARVKRKQVISFLKGLVSAYHSKCKKPTFARGLEEAKMFLAEGRIPKKMLQLRDVIDINMDDGTSRDVEDDEGSSDKECMSQGHISKKLLDFKSSPLKEGDLHEMTHSRSSSKSLQLESRRSKHDGYRKVNVAWRDLDKCNVCHIDEEYENNLFLQCDNCRMMVHAKCYGELEPTGGILWFCNLCRPGAAESPSCCLCPVVGGAMKPTTDGRWAHLACAIWIPETCLFDVKKMEPIDGLSRINKDRWKLLCSICRVPHGACIQCSNYKCCVAYHPLCARAAGFCLEPEDKDKLHLVPFDEDEEDQCIQLLSFCKKHMPPSNERLPSDGQQKTNEKVDSIPPINRSGCARTEPFIFSQKQGRYVPVVPIASFKCLYVENQPYLIGGCFPPLSNTISFDKFGGSKYSAHLQKVQMAQLEALGKICSLTDKYNYMRDTFRKRLAFGKSGIHGFGVFTKFPHRAGDMVIEYIGEVIRRPVADRREHLIYNSLVGAGTYIFRIDDEHIIDATRAGSIAHLINHSCDPNCYSRVIHVDDDDHIIIFAKRDIKQWEELTYDYRLLSTDERLVCSCGSSRCRGIVNDVESEEQVPKLYVSPSELQDCQGE